MATTGISLNRDQLTFLESHFVVYDPVFRECYTDFSRLGNVEVILKGEIHHSTFLQRVQNEFLKRIIGSLRAVLLAEGLPPGQTLKARELPRWQDLPDTLEMQGADIRLNWTSAEFLAWEKLEQQRLQLEQEGREEAAETFRKIAQILNRHLASGRIIKEENCFIVSSEVAQEAETVMEREMEAHLRRNKEINKLGEAQNALGKDKHTQHATVVQSNQGFTQEIIKVRSQFSLIIGVWGKGHFIDDDEMLQMLDKARVSYVILLPNSEVEAKAYDEVSWNRETMPILELTIRAGKEETTFKIPKIFQSHFHPALQSILVATTPEPVVLDVDKLVLLSQKGKTLVFPANLPIHFKHVPLQDYHRLQELFNAIDEESMQFPPYQKDAVLTCMSSMINNMLMPAHLKVDQLNFKGSFTLSFTSMQNTPVLELSSDKPFELTLGQGDLHGYASHLFREMKRLNLSSFSISPQERIIFYDLTVEKRDQIYADVNLLIPWLQSKLLPQTQLSLDGRIGLLSASIDMIGNGVRKEGLGLGTKTGFAFEMK